MLPKKIVGIITKSIIIQRGRREEFSEKDHTRSKVTKRNLLQFLESLSRAGRSFDRFCAKREFNEINARVRAR